MRIRALRRSSLTLPRWLALLALAAMPPAAVAQQSAPTGPTSPPSAAADNEPAQNTTVAGNVPEAGKNDYGMPKCIYCPNAEFSDEAAKAKFQGEVLLSAIIGVDGRAKHIKVVKSLGMGFDANAIKAVKKWRFKPALGPDKKPAAVRAEIEVTFRLY